MVAVRQDRDAPLGEGHVRAEAVVRVVRIERVELAVRRDAAPEGGEGARVEVVHLGRSQGSGIEYVIDGCGSRVRAQSSAATPAPSRKTASKRAHAASVSSRSSSLHASTARAYAEGATDVPAGTRRAVAR
jgi:hypothetical protein